MALKTSHHRRKFSKVSVAFVVGALFLQSSIVFAQTSAEHYTDVQAGVWYEQAADALLGVGALDRSESRLRPDELATRAEVMKLLVLSKDERLIYPSEPSFSDVPRSAWYYAYVETAARAGWIRGDNDCYGQGRRNCMARPSDSVNRAEMAIILDRAFMLGYAGDAPVFPDNDRGVWYFIPIQTAADHCVLQGDDFTGRVRPAAYMNRAEMIVMFYRTSLDLDYGVDCGVQPEPMAEIIGVTTPTSQRIQLTFNVDLDPDRMDNISAYTVERVGGSEVFVNNVVVINARTLELDLYSSLRANATYRVSVEAMQTERGTVFNDAQTFVFTAPVPFIDDVTVRTASMIRVRFSENVDSGRANDAFRYAVLRASGGGEVGVMSATVVNDRVVDLELAAALSSETAYRLNVESMRTQDGEVFSDSFDFTSMFVTEPRLESASFISSTRLRLHFNQDLDEASAEEEFRYRVFGFNGDMFIALATLVDRNTVELAFHNSLVVQEEYSVVVTSLWTDDLVPFSDNLVFVYSPSANGTVMFDVHLNGGNEIPAVSTSAMGTGTFVLTSSGLEYDIELSNLSSTSITAIHFHRGNSGTEGPIIEAVTYDGLRASGVWTNLTAEERDILLEGNVYVNVHTDNYPDGEIRGQVIRHP